jgi:hypothetical protein
MADAINVISRTQNIIVDRGAGAVAVINAGPVGPAGPEGPEGPEGPPGSGGGGLTDGDKGDIIVGGGGTTLTIDNDAVTYAKMQNVSSSSRVLGRTTSGAGNVEEIIFTTQAQSLCDDNSFASMRITLGLQIGADVAPARRIVNPDIGTAFTPGVAHENMMISLSNAAAITVTLPSNATAAFPVGAEVDFLWLGTGQPTFVAGSGATVNGTPGLKMRAQYSKATAKKISTNTWVVYGDLSA